MQDKCGDIRIENESQGDYGEVEALTRKAFWNVNVFGWKISGSHAVICG